VFFYHGELPEAFITAIAELHAVQFALGDRFTIADAPLLGRWELFPRNDVDK